MKNCVLQTTKPPFVGVEKVAEEVASKAIARLAKQ